MATLAQIQQILTRIEADLPILIQQTKIAPKQITIINGLSDMSERLGLIQAGEFRAGNGVEPGFGFSGTRMGYPAFAYESDTWHLAGVNTDVLQFGLSATTGKAYFAAGGAILDSDGATFEAQNNHSYFLFWKTDDDQTVVGKVGAFYVGTDAGIEVVGQTKTGYTPVAHLMTADANSAFLTGIEVRGDGEIQIDLRTATEDAIGDQKVRIMSNTSDTDSPNPILNLESQSKGTVAAGFGTDIVLWAENASGILRKIGSLSHVYTDPTSTSEDAELQINLMQAGGLVTALTVHPDEIITKNVRSEFLTLADDTATSFIPGKTIGGLLITPTAGAAFGGLAAYNTVAPSAAVAVGGANLAATTGILAGTTGTDGKLTISAHTNGRIYVENRMGVIRNIVVLLL